MAMIDYGAIAFKNGKLVSTGMFTPMIDMVGWEDTEQDTYYDSYRNENSPMKLKNNYFAYIGDRDCTIAFYKTVMRITQRIDDEYFVEAEIFCSEPYKWSKYEQWLLNGSSVRVTQRNGYFVCKWKYKGDKYKVYFGYGVDFDYYKEHRVVNYYRSFPWRVYVIKRRIKDKIKTIKDRNKEI